MSRPSAAIFCDCNSRGGVWSYTLRMLELLKALGHRTHLATYRPRNAHERVIHEELVADADAVLCLDPGWSHDRQIRALVRWLEATRPAVYLPNYRRVTYAAAAVVCRREALPVVGVCHADHPSYYDTLVRYASVISLFVCAVERTERTLVDRLPDADRGRVVRIPHFVPRPDGRRATFSDRPFRVLYHGRVREEQKHCSQILEVARRVHDRGADVRFRLLGDGPDVEHYRHTVRRLGLEQMVEFAPSRPWPEVWQELTEHQLGILTSAFEGFCYSAAECLSAGLPLAAYDCGGVLDDYLENHRNGRLVPWGDADALAAYIVSIARDETTWRRQAEQARAVAEESFAMDAVAARYASALASIRFSPSWPTTRPAFVPPRGKSPRAFLDRVGSRRGWWAP